MWLKFRTILELKKVMEGDDVTQPLNLFYLGVRNSPLCCDLQFTYWGFETSSMPLVPLKHVKTEDGEDGQLNATSVVKLIEFEI